MFREIRQVLLNASKVLAKTLSQCTPSCFNDVDYRATATRDAMDYARHLARKRVHDDKRCWYHWKRDSKCGSERVSMEMYPREN